MTLETFKEIYKNATIDRLIDKMRDEVYYISCDSRHAGEHSASHSEKNREYYDNEVIHHKKRFAWLAETVLSRTDPKHSPWVAVEYTLPDNPFDTVLVSILSWNGYGEMTTWETTGCYSGGEWHLDSGTLAPGERVIFWMPFPAPPPIG